MEKYKGLPLYKAEILEPQEGIWDISLVDLPAIQREWVLFNQQDLCFRDEEKRIVSGPVILADTPIIRTSPSLGDYYITFSPETIDLMVEKMSLEGRLNNITLMHQDKLVEGVILVELFRKDSSRGLVPNYLKNIPEGSLVASYKVENDEIWDLIKKGEFTGFSLSGLFSVVPEISPLDRILEQVKDLEESLKS